MIRSAAIAFFILFALISCTKDDNMTYTVTDQNTPAVPSVNDTAGSRSFLALGDSYTIGQSVPETDRFPVQTVTYLNAGGFKFDAPEIIAQTGWTTADLLNKLSLSPPLKTPYDIVTLLIGVNNQYQYRTQKEYADQFLILLNLAIQYAGNNKQHVVVLSIPDYSVTPFANGRNKDLIARQIDSFNVINESISKQKGVGYLDVTSLSRVAADNPYLIASDGLHFSGDEYKIWADALIMIIKRILE